MIKKEVDILIVGGGLIGASLLVALKNSGHSCLLVEAAAFHGIDPKKPDTRTLALAPASVQILKELAIWPSLVEKACPINSIHVSEEGRFGQVNLGGQSQKPLGMVLEMREIEQVLYPMILEEELLAPAKLVQLDPKQSIAQIEHGGQPISIHAKLIVAADGADSACRALAGLSATKKDYQQQAIVANISLARSHNHIAYERFTPLGPLALLPLSQSRAALVWSLPCEKARALMQQSEANFIQSLQQTFGYRLGRFTGSSPRSLFPLREVIMPEQISWPLVFIGNAAHSLHPLAGQGFNLGLRDVAMLAQCIIQQGLNQEMLKSYQELRTPDQKGIIWLSQSLLKLFGSKIPALGILRSAGLLMMDHSNFVKQYMMRYTQGFAGFIPDLVCGIPLAKEPHDQNL